MWTEEHRRIYRREDDGYPNNLRDPEWARLEPMIPPARASGRCGFGQGTFARASGNDEDAPKADAGDTVEISAQRGRPCAIRRDRSPQPAPQC
jgi:hypothetical protein